MTEITIEQMTDKVLTLDQAHRLLAKTEPLSTTDINPDVRARFRLQAGWETDLDATDDTAPVEAFISVGGVEHPLTKEAALQATSEVGIPMALVKKTPARFIEPMLNHFWTDSSKSYKALQVGDNVAAFTKGTIVPFSNLDLLERIQAAADARYGAGTRVFADYKIAHSLHETNLRLILPDIQRDIQDTDMDDVPRGQSDRWLGGVHLRNSLVGKGQTTIEPYLFRWWCTNGCTTEKEIDSAWARTGADGQNLEEVYAWAERAVDEVFDSMEAEFESIQGLTALTLNGNTTDVLAEIFSRYTIPVSQRDLIRDNVENMSGRLSMYSVMNAITEVANRPELADDRRDRLMRIGGKVPGTEMDPIKARVYREGQANPQGANPYEIGLGRTA